MIEETVVLGMGALTRIPFLDTEALANARVSLRQIEWLEKFRSLILAQKPPTQEEIVISLTN